MQKVVLDLIHFPPPHTGTEVANLIKKVFKAWDIKVPIIITDNGSNIIKAFKEVRANHIEEVIENVVASSTEKETSDCGNLYSDIEDHTDEQEEEDHTERDMSFNEEDQPLGFPTNSNSETEESTILLENEEVEHDNFETQITDALAHCRIIRRPNESEEELKLRRLSCLSHRLQLVMSIFDKLKMEARRSTSDEAYETRRNMPAFAKVIAKCRKLVSRINTSSIATPLLIKLAGKKLLSDVSTRWSSNYLVMDNMYTLRKPINDVGEQMGWDGLSNSDWILLKHIIDLLEPFASYTQLVSADKNITFSSAVPCIEELKLHLEECAKIPGLNLVSTAMLQDLIRRHDFMTDENHPEFDSIYLLATCLDINYRIFVLSDQSVQDVLVKKIVKVGQQMGLEYNSISNEEQNQDRDAHMETALEDNSRKNLNTSSFRLLSKKIAQRLSTDTARSPSSLSGTSHVDDEDALRHYTTIESEFLDYFKLATHEMNLKNSSDVQTPMKDAINYWKENAERFPYLAKLALSILAIPASSAPAEREFSAAGWHTVGRKNRTTQDVLAAKVFLTRNKDLLRPMLM